MDIVPTKMANAIAVNATNTVSINCHNRNVRYKIDWNCHNRNVRYKIDWYILHTVLLAIILLLIITVICYHCAKHRSKLKNILPC